MKPVSALLSVFLLIPVAASAAVDAVQEEPQVQIIKATWAGKDVTASAQAWCQDKNPCHYKVSRKFVGEPEAGAQPLFSASWKCLNGLPEALQTIKDAAEDSTHTFSCSIKRVPLKQGPSGLGHVSFRALLSDPSTGAEMTRDLGAACAADINAITHAGNTLRSEKLAKAAQPLSSIRFSSGAQDMRFYHWTNSAGLFDLFKLDSLSSEDASSQAKQNKRFDEMFSFLRTRRAAEYQFWQRVFYVSEDTISSNWRGTRLINFTLDENAKTLSYDLDIWREAVTEVTERYPELARDCKTHLNRQISDTYGTVYFDDIFYIVAEDSGIQVVDYNQDQKWFQVLTPEVFVGVGKGK